MRLTIHLPADIAARLGEQADRQRRDIRDEAVVILERSLRNAKRRETPQRELGAAVAG